MNRKERYFRENPKQSKRYEKVWEQMQLLDIQDVTTKRQSNNGTITWKLPIKNNWPGNQANATCIEVGSFASGYVRNNNSGYSNYQLNKRYIGEPEYFKDYEWETLDNGDYVQKWTGKYRAFTTKRCKLIPIEIDRLEYLIAYCLKNYYIKHANQVAHGEFIPKWRHKYELEQAKCKTSDELHDSGLLTNLSVNVNGQRYKVI